MAKKGSEEEEQIKNERGEGEEIARGGRKRGREMKSEELKKEDEREEKKEKRSRGWALTPAPQTSVRERKAVVRFSFPSPEKESASKVLVVKKGKGMKLEDIPNVAYKLSKRKADDNLRVLHTILFGKKSNKYQMKRNISQFSGFVWAKSEFGTSFLQEKERAKLKEKIYKCVKDRLFDFCQLLDIPVSKASKKEELSTKLLEFLESPHATTGVSLNEKEQKGKKLTRVAKGGNATSPEVRAAESSVEKDVSHDEDDDGGTKNRESDNPNRGSGEEEGEQKKQVESKRVSHKKPVKDSLARKGKAAPIVQEFTSKSVRKEDYVSPSPISKSKGKVLFSREEVKLKKKKNKSSSAKEKKTSKKQGQAGAEVSSEGQTGKLKLILRVKASPTREEMLAVVSRILREADFDVVTLRDVSNQLGAHFGIDLSNRLAEVKSIIQEALKGR